MSTQGINDGGSLDQPEAGSYYPDSLTHSQAAAAVLTGRGSGHSKGIFGGIEIGNNWQVHNDYVVGIEGDFAWLNSKSKTNYSGNQTVCYDYYPDPSYPWLNGPCATDQYEYDTVGSGVSTTAVVDWLSTIRARAGYLIQPNLLTFATGGLALGRVNTSVNISENWTSNYNWQGTITPGEFSYSNPYSVSSSHSAIRVGYAVGGGAEWMISEHWTLKGEYLYYNLGTASFNSDPLVINATYVDNDPNIPVATTAHVRAKAQIDGNLARLGVNYKF